MILRVYDQVMNQRGEAGQVMLAGPGGEEPFKIVVGRGIRSHVREDGTQAYSTDLWMTISEVKARMAGNLLTAAQVIEKEFAPEDES